MTKEVRRNPRMTSEDRRKVFELVESGGSVSWQEAQRVVGFHRTTLNKILAVTKTLMRVESPTDDQLNSIANDSKYEATYGYVESVANDLRAWRAWKTQGPSKQKQPSRPMGSRSGGEGTVCSAK